VTSFRPRSPHLKDDSVLTTVRPVSDLQELYNDFAEYRLEIIEERIRAKLKSLKAARYAGKKFDTIAFKKFLSEQQTFLNHTNSELVQEDQVTHGHIEEMDIPDASVNNSSHNFRKRARVED
jgi:hypothetical protein